MVNEKSVIVKVKPDGSILVEAEGFTGPACVDAVRKYAEALGAAVSEAHKPEFYVQRNAEEDEELTVGGG